MTSINSFNKLFKVSVEISIIIPILNDMAFLPSLIKSLPLNDTGVEILFVDGGSQDGTLEELQKHRVKIIHSQPGRGSQCLLGAQKARGQIFVFHHADSIFPSKGITCIKRFFKKKSLKIAKFRMVFDRDHIILKIYSNFTVFDHFFISFGDQDIIIRQDFYQQIGGFPDWPIFEDVELFRRARQQATIKVLPLKIITSARMFQKKGILKAMLWNGFIFFLFFLGLSPKRIYRLYYRS